MKITKLEFRRRLSGNQNHRCCYCRVETNMYEHPVSTVEHRIPRKNKGTKISYYNCIMACRECNNLRGDMPIGLWLLICEVAKARKVKIKEICDEMLQLLRQRVITQWPKM